MSVIYGNAIITALGGGGLNIDYGSTPPSDTTKLWIPRTTTPSSVEAKYEFKFGNEQLAVSDTNFIPHTNSTAGSMRGIPVGNYIYIFSSSSGGYSGFQRYDMTKNEWDTTFTSAVYPKNALNFVSIAAVDNKIYCLGGYSSSAANYVYEYDIDQNTFTAKTNSPINLSGGCWIKHGDVLYGFGTYYGSYNKVVKYDYITNTFTDVSSEFSFDSSNTIYGNNVYYYPFDAGNGIYYLVPTWYNSIVGTDLIRVDMANKSVTKDISISTLCPNINYSGATTYKDFCFAEAGVVQVGSTGYIIGGRASGSRDVPFIWKVNISSEGLTTTVLDKYLFDPTKSINLAQRRAAACLDNEIHIVEYYYTGSDTSYRSNQTLTLYSPLDNNKLFLQTGFGNNKFNIVNDNKAKVEIAINNAFIGNSENKADEIDAFLCDTNDSKWKNIKTGNDFYTLKGDLIYMDLDGNGNKQYRILNINGNNAECLAMYTANDNQQFNKSNKTTTMGSLTVQQYSGSDLDTYLNTTWYNTLNNTAKAAIVSKVITQDAWTSENNPDTTKYNPIYKGTKGASVPGETTYSIGKYANAELAVGNRNVYALGVQDIIDYLSDESVRVDKTAILRNVNIWKMFYNIEIQPVKGQRTFPWLRSADARNSSSVIWLQDVNGGIQYSGHSNLWGAIPAFTIDLSKIPFTRV